MKKKVYSTAEIKIFKKLDTPAKVQDFVNNLKFNFEQQGETCMSPRRTLKARKAHCMEGAMLAAAILEFHGQKPLVLDLKSIKPGDDDHVVALFRQFGCWGAISKTNHGVLRYREPIYKTISELSISYFHEYFLKDGRKTLREYSNPLNLNYFNDFGWRTSEQDLFEIPSRIDKIRHFKILSAVQIKNLRKADPIEIKAGELVEWKRKKR